MENVALAMQLPSVAVMSATETSSAAVQKNGKETAQGSFLKYTTHKFLKQFVCNRLHVQSAILIRHPHQPIQPVSLPKMPSINQLFYSGTSGLDLPVPRSQYPAEFQGKSRLQYYASLFNSIEINSIFYKLPRNSTVVNWAESVPVNFRFTFKVSKTITHAKGLQFAIKDVQDFMKSVENIGEKKGCLLAQFPPSLKIEKLDQLQRLLETLGEATQNSGWKLAIEFRDPSWYEREVNELLQEYDAAMVIQDIPKSATPLSYVRGDFIYLRFHGPEPRYRGDYSDEFLRQYAQYIKTWISEKKTVYAYFNNTVGAAVENLQTLNKYVQS